MRAMIFMFVLFYCYTWFLFLTLLANIFYTQNGTIFYYSLITHGKFEVQSF